MSCIGGFHLLPTHSRRRTALVHRSFDTCEMIMSCHGLQLGGSKVLHSCKTEHGVATGNTPRQTDASILRQSVSQSKGPAFQSFLSCPSKGSRASDSGFPLWKRLLCGRVHSTGMAQPTVEVAEPMVEDSPASPIAGPSREPSRQGIERARTRRQRARRGETQDASTPIVLHVLLMTQDRH
ncbi:hypothetical protein LY76DRAFT_604811 [Colletotrichum caudatum]|nr:hypothetical protein LY76DRAFT_604811 [Colletotrichum caudatum]